MPRTVLGTPVACSSTSERITELVNSSTVNHTSWNLGLDANFSRYESRNISDIFPHPIVF